jgi:hypothetical protein
MVCGGGIEQPVRITALKRTKEDAIKNRREKMKWLKT